MEEEDQKQTNAGVTRAIEGQWRREEGPRQRAKNAGKRGWRTVRTVPPGGHHTRKPSDWSQHASVCVRDGRSKLGPSERRESSGAMYDAGSRREKTLRRRKAITVENEAGDRDASRAAGKGWTKASRKPIR